MEDNSWRGCRREAFGVRGACSRFQCPATFDSGSKLRALLTLRAVRLRLLRFVSRYALPEGRHYPSAIQTAGPTRVAQVSNLLYRRFPIGKAHSFSEARQNARDSQAGSTAIQQ